MRAVTIMPTPRRRSLAELSKCPVGGPAAGKKIAQILGVDAGSAEKQVAVVRCNGTKEAAKTIMEYDGVKTCAAAKQFFGGLSACPYGCIGLGDCEAACELRRDSRL